MVSNVILASPAGANAVKAFDVRGGDAIDTLKRAARQGGMEIMFLASTVQGVKTNAVKGNFTIREVLDRMLIGTPLRVEQDEKTKAMGVVPARPPAAGPRGPPAEASSNYLSSTQTQPNMTQHRTIFSWLAALFFVTGPAQLPAQTPAGASGQDSAEAGPDRDQTVQLSPFVVSQTNDTGYSTEQTLVGSRSAKDLMDIPGSIDIINKEMLADLNPLSWMGAINLGTAGVTAFQNFQDDMMVRGFRSGSMRDGVVHPGAQTPQPLYDVERIEVIKGPAAMLLGTNSFLGGAINYIPRRPTATPAGEVAVTSNVDEKGKSYQRMVTNVSGPIKKSDDLTVDYRVTLGGVYGDMDKAIEHRKEYFAGGGLLFQFGKNTSLDINFYYYENDTYNYYDDFLDYFAYQQGRLALSRYSATYSSGLRSDGHENEHHGNIDATFLTKLTRNSNLRLFYFYEDTSVDQAIPRFISYLSDGYTINRQYVPYLEAAANSDLQADYLHHLDFKALTNDFFLGLDYSNNYERTADVASPLTPIDIRNPNPNYSGDAALIAKSPSVNSPGGLDSVYRTDLLSYYVQENVGLLDGRIDLIAGLRWFYQRALTEDRNYLIDGGGLYATPVDYSPLQVHKWGIVVKPVSWLSLYWTNATNETAQSGFTNPPSGPPVPYGNNVGELTEFGAKLKYKLTNKLEVYGSVAHFNMALTNVYTTDSSGALGANGFPVTTVADNTSNGVEMELGARVGFSDGYGDVFATDYRGDTLSAGVPVKHRASGSPGKVYSLLAKYTWTGGFLKGFMIGGGVYGQGPRYELNLPIDTPNLYNLFSRYQLTKNWSVQLNADNVTNKRYIVRIATTALVEASLPGQLSLAVRYKW